MRVRVSIANLAWRIRNLHTSEFATFGILNSDKLKQGKRQYVALGGGAMLTDAGKTVLETAYQASDFELDKDTGFFDARFITDESQVETIFDLFKRPSLELEQDPTLDILHELSVKQFLGHKDTLRKLVRKAVNPTFLQSVRQGVPEVGKDTSGRALADIPTRRLFRIFELWMAGSTFEKFKSSQMVRLLTDDELRTTDGGRTVGRTSDGVPIQNNLFLI